MKKILTTILAVMMTVGLYACSGSQENTTPDDTSMTWPAMDALQSLSTTDITMIEYSRATEGGISAGQIVDATMIEDIYLKLKDVSFKSKSEMGVDDDGLDIKIETNNKTLNFNFEGDILVLEDGSRYEVDNLHPLKSYIDALIAENE